MVGHVSANLRELNWLGFIPGRLEDVSAFTKLGLELFHFGKPSPITPLTRTLIYISNVMQLSSFILFYVDTKGLRNILGLINVLEGHITLLGDA